MSRHDWEPTTETFAVFKCTRCGAVGFNSRTPLPQEGCKNIYEKEFEQNYLGVDRGGTDFTDD